MHFASRVLQYRKFLFFPYAQRRSDTGIHGLNCHRKVIHVVYISIYTYKYIIRTVYVHK